MSKHIGFIKRNIRDLTITFNTDEPPPMKLKGLEYCNLTNGLCSLDLAIDNVTDTKTRQALDACKTIMWNILNEAEEQ